MKKLYTLVAFLSFAAFATAQNGEALAGSCVNAAEETITIVFDDALNCTKLINEGKNLTGYANIGLHSGFNGWMNVVGSEGATSTALQLENDGSDVYTGTYSPVGYYDGLADFASLTEINFVLNSNPETPDAPWTSEGKDNNADGTDCADFKLIIADMPACESSTVDLVLASSLQVTPNPFSDVAVITFANPNNKLYNVTVTSLTGQVVRTINRISGSVVEIERNDLSAGMYFATFQSEDGKIATTKLVVR